MTVIERCDPEVYRLRMIMAEAAKQDPVTCRKWIRDALGSMPSVPSQPQGAVDPIRAYISALEDECSGDRRGERVMRPLREAAEAALTRLGGQ